MGHRALVGYERPDGLFNVHFSHWGAGVLAERITPETPLGGDNPEPAYIGSFTAMLDEMAEANDLELGGALAEAQDTTAVRPTPRAVGVTIRDIARHELDYLFHEAFYVVNTEFDVREFRTFYTDFEPGQDDHYGLAVEVESDSYERGVYRGMRNTVEDMIHAGELTPGVASDRLIRLLLERYEEHLSDQVLAVSSALDESHWQQYQCAFFKATGRSRVLGEMYPSGIRQLEPWELPSSFPTVKTANGTRVQLPAEPE